MLVGHRAEVGEAKPTWAVPPKDSKDRAGRTAAQCWLWDVDVREEWAPVKPSTLTRTYPGS